jgi:hypothetical protein
VVVLTNNQTALKPVLYLIDFDTNFFHSSVLFSKALCRAGNINVHHVLHAAFHLCSRWPSVHEDPVAFLSVFTLLQPLIRVASFELFSPLLLIAIAWCHGFRSSCTNEKNSAGITTRSFLLIGESIWIRQIAQTRASRYSGSGFVNCLPLFDASGQGG